MVATNPQPQSSTPTWYFVRSSNNPNVFYRLSTDRDGALVCECTGFGYRHHCRHVRAVIAGDALAATPRRTGGKNWTLLAPTPAPQPAPAQAPRPVIRRIAVTPDARDRAALLEV